MGASVRPDPPTRYIANLPLIGQGMLDTLRALSGVPLHFDTTRSNARVAGEYQNGRVIINPAVMEQMVQRSPTAKAGYFDGAPAGMVPSMTLAHEVLGHGVAGTNNEQAANMWARAWVRLSGRDPQLPYLHPQEMIVEGRLRRMLALLQGMASDGR